MRQEEKDEIISYLRLEGRKISNFARQGWDCANKIINYYDLVYSCPGDNAAWAFLGSAVKEYKERVIKENTL